MKCVICSVLMLVFFSSAVSGQVNYRVSGEEAYVALSPDASGNISIAASYAGKPVLGIDGNAFYNCTNLVGITLPNTVVGVGGSAFEACSYLTNVVFGNGVKYVGDRTFYGCFNLRSVSLSQNVTNLGDFAFAGCRNLTNAVLGIDLSRIGTFTFAGCSNLTSITIPASVTHIGYGAFQLSGLTSIFISLSVQTVEQSAFYKCASLTNIAVDTANTSYSSSQGALLNKAQTVLIKCPEGLSGGYQIPFGVNTINAEAFLYCRNLTNVAIPNSVTSIGTAAFLECGIETVIIPDSVVGTIDNGMFQACTNLTSATIGAGVTGLGTLAFSYCVNLTNIAVAGANPTYSSLSGTLFNKSQTVLIKFPPGRSGGYTIPSGITNVGSRAFYWCTNLTSVTCGDSVTQISSGAFDACVYLTNVTLAGNLTSIGTTAFQFCNRLTDIVIPASVVNIGSSAFGNCSNLVTIVFLGNPPNTGESAFPSVGIDAKVYYYFGSTGWGPTYAGLPTIMLFTSPQVVNNSAAVQSGGFGFTINGIPTQTIIVENSSDLVSWQPMWTNILSGASVNFVDTQWTNYLHRFYRVR